MEMSPLSAEDQLLGIGHSIFLRTAQGQWYATHPSFTDAHWSPRDPRPTPIAKPWKYTDTGYTLHRNAAGEPVSIDIEGYPDPFPLYFHHQSVMSLTSILAWKHFFESIAEHPQDVWNEWWEAFTPAYRDTLRTTRMADPNDDMFEFPIILWGMSWIYDTSDKPEFDEPIQQRIQAWLCWCAERQIPWDLCDLQGLGVSNGIAALAELVGEEWKTTAQWFVDHPANPLATSLRFLQQKLWMTEPGSGDETVVQAYYQLAAQMEQKIFELESTTLPTAIAGPRSRL